MERTVFALGSALAALGVALGAFGAHTLKTRIAPEMLAVFETGVRYQLFHALALIVTGLVVRRRRGRAAPGAGWLFVIGTVLFSGSLYTLVLTGERSWGAVTPIGGVLWLAAWALLAFAGMRTRERVVEIGPEE